MVSVIGTVELTVQQDILRARQQSRRIAELLEFDVQDQSRIGAAASEIAREMVSYTAGGVIRFLYFLADSRTPVFALAVSAHDHASFSAMLKSMDGIQPSSDAGKGLINASRLMDRFFVRTTEAGTQEAVFGKIISRAKSDKQLRDLSRTIQMLKPNDLLEMTQVNEELLNTIELLRKRQEEIARLNLELEETNRGVVALYAELDEKAEQLRRADHLKTRFLSNTSHEFRTPLNSILGLSKLLLTRQDGDLTAEQEKQVRLILQSAQGLTEMVNDLLDIAKIEAGKTVVKPNEFEVAELFGALRGMFRPIAINPEVSLLFSEATDLPRLYTEEGKVSQILRNFISNALKFTTSGEIHVEAIQDDDFIVFSVADTGIGIAPEDQGRLFHEFSQVDSPLHKGTKGSGLGLALCKKLSELLGGSVAVRSEPGKGSIFFSRIPIVYQSSSPESANFKAQVHPRQPNTVLIIDDDEASRYLMRSWFHKTEFAVVEAGDALQGLEMTNLLRPEIIILDLNMPRVNGYEFLNMLRSNPQIASTPVIINTSKILDESETRFLQTHVAAILSKSDQSPEIALQAIRKATGARSTLTP